MSIQNIKLGNRQYIFHRDEKIGRSHEKGNLNLPIICEEINRNLYRNIITDHYFMQCIACGHNFPTIYPSKPKSHCQRDLDRFANEYMEYQVSQTIVI